MEIIIQSPHFTPDKRLSKLVDEKAKGLRDADDRISKCEIWLKTEKSDKGQHKVCEIKVIAPHLNFFISRESETFEESLMHIFPRLEQQIKEHIEG